MARIATLTLLWLASLVGAFFLGGYFNGPPEIAPSISTAEQTPVKVQAPAVLTDHDQLAIHVENNRLFAAIDLVQQMISRTPSDMSLRFRLAILYEKTSQLRLAIAELLAIRSLSLESADLVAARHQIDEISERAHQNFKSNQQTAAAKDFFEDLQVLEPSHDRHRWYLAQWLISSGDTQAAQRLVNETGLSGISQAEKDQLQTELTQLASTLDVRREGGAMFADILATTPHNVVRLNMLLDTGATLTAISLSKLREVGARRTPHMVNVQTANGMITLPIYEVDQLDAGPLQLTDVAVVALTDALPQADGLLGLDVLDQLPTPITWDR